jgi:hypothetical protein
MTPVEYMWYRVPAIAVERYKEIEPQVLAIWEKEANWPRRAAELAQLLPAQTPLPMGIPSNPSPLLGTLVGGLAGAGIGYGLGALGESVMPRTWERGKLRRTLALVGGGLGASPGAMLAYSNFASGKPVNDMTGITNKSYDVGEAMKVRQTQLDSEPLTFKYSPIPKQGALLSGSGVFGGFDQDEFNNVVWSDPRISKRLPPEVLAAASGLVTGAANLPGKTTRLVTPADIGRMAVGMGAGYLSGMLVGKGLGVLMGMPDKTQEKFKETGMWAGAINALVPVAFGR